MTIKCGIINNDALAINVLKSYIDKMPETELVIASQNALKIRSRINKETIDLLFLDVEIPDISGYEFLQTLINPPKIIITSGSKKYAAEAFELDVLDYIVMPAVFKRFLTAIKKYQKQNLVVYETPALINYLFLKENKKMVKVELADILYVESIKDYIKVVTSDKTVITKELISSFYNYLPSINFIRPHRSFLVNINKIEAYSSRSIEITGVQIPIGRNYKEDCLNVLDHINKQMVAINTLI